MNSGLADRLAWTFSEAIQIANLHPRVKMLRPGIGVGGHCISVDPWFFVEAAPDLSTLIYAARKVNDTQPEFIVSMMEREFGVLAGHRIALLGFSYKPDVDDLRESPVLELALGLRKRGAVVWGYEPFKPQYKVDGITMCPTLYTAINGADIIVLAVAHTQFINISPSEMASLTQCRRVFDPVNGWNGKPWTKSGFVYSGIGRGIEQKLPA